MTGLNLRMTSSFVYQH